MARARHEVHRWMLLAAMAVPCIGTAEAQVIGPNFRLPPCAKIENEPSLAAQGSHVVAVWNTDCVPRSPLAAASLDGGTTWQATAIPWAGLGDAPAAVCAGDSGRFYLAAASFYDLVGWSVEVHGGVFVGPTFTWQRLANPVPVPYDDTDEEPVSMAIEFDRTSHNLYVVFTKVLSFLDFFEYRTTFVRSTDGGQSWEPAQELTGRESAGAKLVVGTAGELTVVWENYVQGKLFGRRSDDFGASFGPEFEVLSLLDPLAEPMGWVSEHSRRNPAMPAGNSACLQGPAAFSVAVDRSAGPRRGTWYAVTTERATGTVGPLTGTVSEVENNRYYASANPITIGNDVNGSVTSSETVFDLDRYTFTGEAGQTIWVNGIFFSVPGGAPFGHGVNCGDDTTKIASGTCMNMVREGTGPPLIYTLPSTGRYYVGASPALFYTIGYRMRTRTFTVDASSVARDHRDILMCSSTDGGATWSPKVRVSDGPIGNEETFAEVAVDDEGRLHVAWYDRRDAIQCGAEANTYWSWSDDGGASFAPALRVSEIGSAYESTWGVGDHLGLATANGKVYVAWTRVAAGGGEADVWGAVISDVPTPVLVSGLSAEPSSGGVDLRWWASEASKVVEFRVHRAMGSDEFAVVARVTPGSVGEHRWRDQDVSPGVTYRYRLEALTRNGVSVWDGPVELVVPVPAHRLAWRGATPNPFDAEVVLDLETPNASETKVAIYDVTGHLVSRLAAELRGQIVSVRWNGRDGRGRIVSPGVYLIRAQLGANVATRQVVRMK